MLPKTVIYRNINQFRVYALVSCVFVPSLLKAAIVYVDKDAAGANDGSSWADAFTELDVAFGGAVAGDQIWVAEGVYKPTTTGRFSSFYLPNAVALYGGFAGFETQLSQRDWTLNETVMSGDIGVAGNAFDNCYHAVYAANVGSSTRLDGFKITGGRADASPGSFYNEHGGGLYVDNSSLTIANCTLIANHASTRGGAIYHEGNGFLNIVNSKIYNNTSLRGGGIYFEGGQINITGTDFSDNQATSYGGGIYMDDGTGIIDRCIFSGNLGTVAAIYQSSGSVNVYNSLFAGNYGDIAVCEADGTLVNQHLWNCTLVNNKVINTTGDPTFIVGYYTSIRNCIFWGNASQSQIYTSSNVSHCIVQGGFSGGTSISSADPAFIQPGNSAFAPFNASAYNYRVLATSPAINSGSNSYVSSTYNHDLDDSVRISGNTVDRGCYERYFCSISSTISASGPTSFCTGASVTLTASSGSSYSWSTGDTTQSITVSAQNTYAVTVTDSNGCFGNSSQQITVTPLSVQITGGSVLCSGQTLVLAASSAGSGNSYAWSTGDTAQSITVSAQGSYSVTITDVNGCSGSSTRQVTVPSPSVQITGNSSFCSGQILVLTASSAGSGNSYAWSTGAATQSINVTQSGSYTVTVTTSDGCTAVSPPKTITQIQSVTPSVSLNANKTAICAGESIIFTATPTNGGNPVYDWQMNGTSIGFNGNPYVTSSTQDGDEYSVIMTSSMQCATPQIVISAAIPISVTSVNTPVITQSGNSLISSSLTGNQWYVSGTLIAGAVNQTITISQPGNYVVVVTVNGCGSAPSNTITVPVVGLATANNDIVAIFPNPVIDKLIIKSPNEAIEQIRIHDATGRAVHTSNSAMNSVDIHRLHSGIYTLQIKFKGSVRMFKFEKL